MRLPRLAALAAAAAFVALPARAGSIVFNADTSDPKPRAAFDWVVRQFQAENPDVTVKFNVYDHESYKQSVRNWLTSAPPDVVRGYSGTRMRQFSTPGLLADVSDLWTDKARARFGGAVETVTDGGKQYGVPYSYYQWGIFYRSDIFTKAGVTSLKTWDDLLAACDKLKAAGVEPIAIGSKDLWPTAGWFDYLNLRINGFDFHHKLTDGKVSWEDDKVRAVFARWKELLDKGCFAKNHTSLAWQESQSLLYQGKSALMLIGNFITQGFPPEVADKMDFTPFPQVVPGIPDAEEAPMESINIPAHAANIADAKKFLAFMMRADVQTKVNELERQIPANHDSSVADDRFLKAGQTLLNGATNITQFLDRDTSEDLATIAMKGFQEFMVRPDRINTILATIEKARTRIYGPL